MSRKIAVVTGASSGIGKSIALSLATAGIEVIGLARRLDLLEELSQEAQSINAATIAPLQVDVTDEDSVVNGFKWIEKQHGGIDIFVANAGLGGGGNLSEGETETWRAVIDHCTGQKSE